MTSPTERPMSNESVTDERLAELRQFAAGLDWCIAEDDRKDWDAAFAELQSLRSKPVAGVEVKPLEWEPLGPVGSDLEASTPFGQYVIATERSIESKTWNLWRADQGDEEIHASSHSSCAEAKAAAEADYRNRILSALLPKATAPVGSEPVAYLVKDKFAPSISPTVLLASSSVLPSVRLDTERFDLSPLYASPQPEAVITEEMVANAMRLCAKIEAVYGWLDMSSEEAKENYASYAEEKAKLLSMATAALKES